MTKNINKSTKKSLSGPKISKMADAVIDDMRNSRPEPKYIGFPIDQFGELLGKLGILTQCKGDDCDRALTLAFQNGMIREIVNELIHALREAKDSFTPNPKDNPHRVVLIRNMAPIV